MIEWWWLLLISIFEIGIGGYWCCRCYRAGLWGGITAPARSTEHLRSRGWKI